jgi:succinoglycan biosynthesis transport protein ExoP
MESQTLGAKLRVLLPGGVLGVLWRRKFLIAGIVLVLLSVNIAVGLLMPRSYRAEALLQVDQRHSRVIDGNMASLAADLDEGKLASQVDLIRSPTLALRVIASTNLLETPEFARALARLDGQGPSFQQTAAARLREALTAILPEAIAERVLPDAPRQVQLPERVREEEILRQFARRLQVSYDTRGYSLRIGYESADPVLAATVANGMARAYVEEQMRRKLDILSSAGGWLDERIEGLRVKAVEAENRLATFRQEHQLGTIQAPAFTQQQLADLHTQLITAVSDSARAGARLANAEEAARARRLADLPEAVTSPSIRTLREHEVSAQRRIAELSWGGNLRTAGDARAELTEIQRQIANEHDRILNSIRADAAVATLRRRSLEDTIARLTGEAERRETYAVQAAMLEREAVANRAVFDAAVQRTEETRTLNGLQRPDVAVVSEARVPGTPAWPKLSHIAIFGLVASLGVGIGVALFLELRRLTIRSLAQGEALLGIVGLGWVPAAKLRGGTPDGLVLAAPRHLFAECLRSVAVSMKATFRRERQVVLVTSALPGDGKSTFAISYARTLASAGQSCLLIDADLRRRTATQRVGAPSAKGLSDLALSGASLDELVAVEPESGLAFIGGGAPVLSEDARAADPLRILDGKAFDRLIAEARTRFDTVVIDAPPLLPLPDGVMLAQQADVTLLVGAFARTPLRAMEQAVDRLRVAGVTAVSFVLSRVEPSELRRGEVERLSMSYALGTPRGLRHAQARLADPRLSEAA